MEYFTRWSAVFFSRNQINSVYRSKFISILLLVSSLLFLSACGSSGNGNEGSNNTPSIPISGYVIDGPISNSSVTLHRINADGSIGEQVAGPFVTDENGKWSGSTQGISSILVVVASGGQYTDDATGEVVTLTSEETMNSWYDPAKPDRNRVVSPITDSLWQMVQKDVS